MSESTVASTLPGGEVAPTFRERVIAVLRRPREAFAAMGDADAWFWPAILLLIGYTIYNLAYGMGGARLQASWMSSVMPTTGSSASTPAARNLAAFMAWFAPTLQLFGNVTQVPLGIGISWACRTALFYGLARLLGGCKPYWGRVVAMVGWAWLPLFLQYTVCGLLMLAVPEVMGFLLPMNGNDLSQVARQMQHRWHGQMFFYLSPLVFWNLALCVIGVAELFRLPRWKATIVVLIPTVADLLSKVVSYLFSVEILKAFSGMPGAKP